MGGYGIIGGSGEGRGRDAVCRAACDDRRVEEGVQVCGPRLPSSRGAAPVTGLSGRATGEAAVQSEWYVRMTASVGGAFNKAFVLLPKACQLEPPLSRL